MKWQWIPIIANSPTLYLPISDGKHPGFLLDNKALTPVAVWVTPTLEDYTGNGPWNRGPGWPGPWGWRTLGMGDPGDGGPWGWGTATVSRTNSGCTLGNVT
jgi:hypothetical protein